MQVMHGTANGEQYTRLEFDSFEDLEAYFMENCFGVKGLRTKVIGKVLLVQQRKEI